MPRSYRPSNYYSDRNENFGSTFLGGLADVLQNAPDLYNQIGQQKYQNQRQSLLDQLRQDQITQNQANADRSFNYQREQDKAKGGRQDSADQFKMLLAMEAAQAQRPRDKAYIGHQNALSQALRGKTGNSPTSAKPPTPYQRHNLYGEHVKNAKSSILKKAEDYALQNNLADPNSPYTFDKTSLGESAQKGLGLTEGKWYLPKSLETPMPDSTLFNMLQNYLSLGTPEHRQGFNAGDSLSYYYPEIYGQSQNGTQQQGSISREAAIAELKRRGEL